MTKEYTPQQPVEDDIPFQCKKRIEAISKGLIAPEIETKCLQGIKVIRAEKGFFLCTFLVPKTLADINGNWHPGAIAVLIDDLAATAVATVIGKIKLSVEFDISFLSQVKIEEEVEIEAKVVSDQGKLTFVLVEVRRKDNGEVVALAKQWMTAFNTDPPKRSKL